MNDRTYMKVMVALGEDLEHVASADEFDQDAYDKVIESIKRTNRVWWHSRRRRSWFMILLLWISLGALFGLVFRILFLN